MFRVILRRTGEHKALGNQGFLRFLGLGAIPCGCRLRYFLRYFCGTSRGTGRRILKMLLKDVPVMGVGNLLGMAEPSCRHE